MLELGKKFAQNLKLPCVIELIGDVGAGKTTFTRGLAQGLGIDEAITSPTFVLSKRYCIPPSADHNEGSGILVHYDFYRLPDPGIMSEELAETIVEPNSLVVVEWAESVSSLLPEDTIQVKIELEDDGSRLVEINNLS